MCVRPRRSLRGVNSALFVRGGGVVVVVVAEKQSQRLQMTTLHMRSHRVVYSRR